jgi:hypothetical protein
LQICWIISFKVLFLGIFWIHLLKLSDFEAMYLKSPGLPGIVNFNFERSVCLLLQCHCYNFVHENVGNPALNTRPTIFKLFFVYFYYFRGGLVKSLISNIYHLNIRLWMKCNHLMQRENFSLTQNKSEKMNWIENFSP